LNENDYWVAPETCEYIHYEDLRPGGPTRPIDHTSCRLRDNEPTYVALLEAVSDLRLTKWDEYEDEPRLAELEARMFRLQTKLMRVYTELGWVMRRE